MGFEHDRNGVFSLGRRRARRQLRGALVFHGQVVGDVTLVPGASLTVGESGSETLTVRPVGLSDGFEVLRSQARGESGVLRLTTAVGGWVCIDGREQSLADLCWRSGRAVSSTRVLSPSRDDAFDSDDTYAEATIYEVSISPGDWGVIWLGETELVFQFVSARQVGWWPRAGGPAWRSGAERSSRGVLGAALVVSLMIQAAVLFGSFWPQSAASQGRSGAVTTTTTTVEAERWVEHRVGAVAESVEEPAGSTRLRHVLRRVGRRVVSEGQVQSGVAVGDAQVTDTGR